MKKGITHIIFLSIIFASCQSKNGTLHINAGEVRRVTDAMTNSMVHDVTNPPLVSRFFSYATLAGYEVVSQNNSKIPSLYKRLKDYPQITKPSVKDYNYQVASVYAMLFTAGELQPSGMLLDSVMTSFANRCKEKGMPSNVLDSSKKYGGAIAKAILKYAKEDGYRNISEHFRYTPIIGEGYWYPTPPAFIAAVEPYFKTVRPFLLDSCSQFKPLPPAAYSKDTTSAFYEVMNAVYRERNNSTVEHKAIAAFWDCNPFAVQDNGHLQVGIKKISPGAHWLGITGEACNKAGLSFDSTVMIHALVSITLMDAFICCWDEKYRSNRIRPETAIRKQLNKDWMPLLQTPPFPEYPSGHSVISTAAAEVLTKFFSNNFSFTDSVEMRYGLPVRTFASFHAAADEAAVSRFYGGIHFMDAVVNGQQAGKSVGIFIVKKLKI